MYNLQPPKKSRGCVNVLAVIGGISLALFAIVLLGGFTLLGSTPAPSSHEVIYKVTTNLDSGTWPTCNYFDTTYDLRGGTAQKTVSICDGDHHTEVDRFTAQRGDFVYLSVQNGQRYGGVTCQIFVDGALLYHTHSDGQYVIASCSGSIP